MTSEERMADLERRIVDLETGTKVVRAEALHVVDKNGKVRALLAVDKDGPDLVLYDENGKVRALLAVDKDGSGLRLYDENEKYRAGLTVLKDGAGLWLFDENGIDRVGLVVLKDGRPGLAFMDEKGKIKFRAP